MIDPLWQKFQVILLTENHRQGEDFNYAEILNRIRTGDHTEEDCKILRSRTKAETSSELPLNALYIICTNDGVNKLNASRLESLEGDQCEFIADVRRSGKPAKKPRLNRDGSIFNTPLQYQLHLKVGAKVILTYNINVIDSLTNGAIGRVMGFEKCQNGSFKSVLVHFNNEKIGRERRKTNSSYLHSKYPGIPVTPITRIEFRFNLSKNPTSQNDLMTATQFPLKLAFACTAHKMQGTTIAKPEKLVIDLKSVKEPAQAYVMMSRVQSLQQLFIVNEFPQEKIYPSREATNELKRLHEIASNEEEQERRDRTMILSLNIRSLQKHYKDFQRDYLAGP